MPRRHFLGSGLLLPALLCTAAFTAHATPIPFANGDFVTYSQDSWGGIPSPGNAAELLLNNFDSLYGGIVEVGVPLNAGRSVIFTSALAVLNYLPSSGAPGPLTQDQVDPTSTSSGLWGGVVLALQLNVDFADANLLTGSAGIPYGDLLLCDLDPYEDFEGLTIRQFLAEMNIRLGAGAGPDPHTYDDLFFLTQDVSEAFEGGTPSQFAQDHLCLPQAEVVPEPATAGLVLLGLLGLGARRASRRSR